MLRIRALVRHIGIGVVGVAQAIDRRTIGDPVGAVPPPRETAHEAQAPRRPQLAVAAHHVGIGAELGAERLIEILVDLRVVDLPDVGEAVDAPVLDADGRGQRRWQRVRRLEIPAKLVRVIRAILRVDLNVVDEKLPRKRRLSHRCARREEAGEIGIPCPALTRVVLRRLINHQRIQIPEIDGESLSLHDCRLTECELDLLRRPIGQPVPERKSMPALLRDTSGQHVARGVQHDIVDRRRERAQLEFREAEREQQAVVRGAVGREYK